MSENAVNSRRTFLKTAGLTSLAAVTLPKTIADAYDKTTDNKNTNDLIFLFQGDSITDGNRGRNFDPNHIMGHGYAFSIASRIGADFPEKKLKFYNRGISGNKVSDLEQRWKTDTLDLKPDVLSILIGINDISNFIWTNDSVFAEKFEHTYASLLNQVKEQNPDILLVLCQPFILPVGKVKEKWDQYQSEIEKKQEIVRNLAQSYHAVLVDFQKVMNDACKRAPFDYWMWDGIHPTVPGHELLARQWIREVSKKLSFLKIYK